MVEEIIIRSDTFYCALWLQRMTDLPARNWEKICRMLPRDSRNDESIRTLREWFPTAINKAKEEKADATRRIKITYRDPATVPKKLRRIQKEINDDNRRNFRAAERNLKTLEARYETFNEFTKEI